MFNNVNSSNFSNLYNSQELKGEFLVAPLKSYNQFVAKKFNGDSFLATRVTLIFASLIAYPILGELATIGMAIKFMNRHEISRYNNVKKTICMDRLKLLNNSPADWHSDFGRGAGENLTGANWSATYQTKEEFTLTNENFNENCKKISDAVDAFTKQYKRINLSFTGKLDEGITFHLQAREWV